jgi:hypothetical protein
VADCCCGNPEGTNKECERCRLISELSFLKRCLNSLRAMGFPVIEVMANELKKDEKQ